MSEKTEQTFTESEVPILGGGTPRLMIPRGMPGLPPLIFDLSKMLVAEARLPEVKVVSIHTFTELGGEFTLAYNVLTKIMTAVEYELMNLKTFIDKLKSKLLIDDYPSFFTPLKKQGMTDNQELRMAFFMKDQAFETAIHKLNALTAINEWIKHKQRVFTQAYQSTKKIVDAKNGNMGGFNG